MNNPTGVVILASLTFSLGLLLGVFISGNPVLYGNFTEINKNLETIEIGINRYRTALKFYADVKSYQPHKVKMWPEKYGATETIVIDIQTDYGRTARKALGEND